MNQKILYTAGCTTLAFAFLCRVGVGAPSNKSPAADWEHDGKGESRSGPPHAKHPSSKKPDQATADKAASSSKRFPDTAVGHALDKHLETLVDISAGADDQKERSLVELRKNAKEASQDLLAAYHGADPEDGFGRWLLTLTLWQLNSNEAYAALHEIAYSDVPANLKDNDHEGSQVAHESAIRQSAVAGLASLAHAGNAAAEKDLLSLAVKPKSKDDAIRWVAIKGYLAAGKDYEARAKTLKAQLPVEHHDLVTLTDSPLEEPSPAELTAPKAGGKK